MTPTPTPNPTPDAAAGANELWRLRSKLHAWADDLERHGHLFCCESGCIDLRDARLLVGMLDRLNAAMNAPLTPQTTADAPANAANESEEQR